MVLDPSRKTYRRKGRQSLCFGGVCNLPSKSKQTYKRDFKHLKCVFYIAHVNQGHRGAKGRCRTNERIVYDKVHLERFC